MSVRRVLFASLLMMSSSLGPVSAETIQGALAKAYQLNSSLNSARAGVRATDENVPLAKSGYRPTIAGQLDGSYTSRNQGTNGGNSDTSRITAGTFGIQINQTLFDGFQTRNNVRGAESQVRAANENLRNTSQNTLLNAATAYMDVIRDRQIATLTEQNLAFLNEQVRAAKSRFDVGEGTRTDVAQADASRASAVASVSDARARVMASSALYRQYVGEEPGKLASAKALRKLLPKSVDSAQTVAFEEHPAILASEYLINAAGFKVKSSEGALLPQLEASAGVTVGRTHTHGTPVPPSAFPPSPGNPDGIGTSEDGTATIGATLRIPLYQGGRVAATVRQNKELLGQARIDLDVNRDQVRQALSTAWSTYRAANEGVEANRTLVSARRLALNGVIEERNVGQRTTLDVLEAQADVIDAQIALAQDERDVVVASYAILMAMGRLSPKRLGLEVAEYRPEEHYEAVKDKWFGLRTPDGR